MTETRRPLSPHLEIYRWQVSNTLSILHRATGAFMSLGAVGLVAWLLALAGGPDSYMRVMPLFGGLPGELLLAAWTFCLCYHLCNGVRHMLWDVGVGFDKRVARLSGWAVVGTSTLLTLVIWIVAIGTRGGGV